MCQRLSWSYIHGLIDVCTSRVSSITPSSSTCVHTHTHAHTNTHTHTISALVTCDPLFQCDGASPIITCLQIPVWARRAKRSNPHPCFPWAKLPFPCSWSCYGMFDLAVFHISHSYQLLYPIARQSRCEVVFVLCLITGWCLYLPCSMQ